MATSYEDYLKSLESKKKDLSYDAYAEKTQNEQPKDNEPTIESEYLQPIYNVGDKLKYLDKFTAPARAGIVQTATLGHPIEAIKSELSTNEPQPSSYMTNRLRELLPGQEPMIDTAAEDIAQGQKGGVFGPLETLKGLGKTWLKSEAPKAYNVVSEMVPSDVAGMVADEFISGKIPSVLSKAIPSQVRSQLPSMSAANIAPTLEDYASKNRARALQRVSNLVGEDADKSALNLKTEIAADTLNRKGLSHLISNPADLHDELNGKYVKTFNKDGAATSVKQPGLIDSESMALNQAADYFSQTKSPININDIANKVFNEISNEVKSESRLGAYSKDIEFKIFKEVNENLKAIDGEKERTVSDLIQLKRDAADFVYDIKNNPDSYGVEGPTKLKMYKKFWSAFDNAIKDSVSGDANARPFIQANADLSDLLHVRNVTTGAENAKLQMPGYPEIGVGVIGGKLLGEAIDHPLAGMIIGGGVGAAKGALGQMGTTLPNRFANIQQSIATKLSANPGAINAIQNAPSNIIAAGRQVNYPSAMQSQAGRSPQSINEQQAVNVPSPQQQLMMRKGFVENLAEFKIPRTVNGIMQNKELVLAKLAQVTNDQATVDTLRDSLNMHPDLLKSTLPALQMQFPQIFQPNKYMSWSNGRILDPMEVQKAYKEVNDRGISNTEKVMLQDGLNRDGSFPESF